MQTLPTQRGITPVPGACSTLAHLQWTLNFDWRQVDGGSPLRSGWLDRATEWRQGRADTAAWMQSMANVPDRLSFLALQDAQVAAGLHPAFRTGPAFCRRRTYGFRPGLDVRFAHKLDRDAVDDAAPLARAVRGFLDIIHVHPFRDGNARAACTWLTWSLVTAGINVRSLAPVIQLPMAVGDDRLPALITKLLQ